MSIWKERHRSARSYGGIRAAITGMAVELAWSAALILASLVWAFLAAWIA